MKPEHFLLTLIIFVAGCVMSFLIGEQHKQHTIVRECKENSVYVDRNLILKCEKMVFVSGT